LAFGDLAALFGAFYAHRRFCGAGASLPIVADLRFPNGPRCFVVHPDQPLVGTVNAEARIAAVRPDITTKGMYLANLSTQLPADRAEQVWSQLQSPPRHGKYQAFLDYPFADALRWLHAVAEVKYPRQTLLEALRRIGRDTVRVFLESRAGRIVQGMPMGPREALLRMPEMWKATDPCHTVIANPRGTNAIEFDVRGFPGWIDCGLIGTLEQVVIFRNATPSIEVALAGPERGTFLVRFEQA
jgi:uncharacterized protein (TIGR02265 family)